MLARTVHGARPSLYTGLIVVTLTGIFGLAIGLTSAYFAGLFDLIVQRIVDGLMAIPGIVFAMSLLSVFNRGIDIGPLSIPVVWRSIPTMVVIALCIVLTPSTSRVVRSPSSSGRGSPACRRRRAKICCRPWR